MSDDFEDDAGVDESFDDFEEQKPTLGSVWKSNPAFKFLAVGGVALVIFAAVGLMGGGEEADLPPQQDSYVPANNTVTSAPGTGEMTPAYIEAIEQQNDQDLERAQSTGGSVLPVPIDPPVGVITDADEEDDAEDPLRRWRRLQEERLQKEMEQREELQQLSVDNSAEREEAIKKLSGVMRSQMSSILGSKETVKISTMNVTDASFLKNLREKEEEAAEGGGNGDGSDGDGVDGFGEEVIQETLLPAGEIVYAQLLTEANTDAPMPVLARVLSGPFAGAKLIGSFTEQRELLLITFNKLVIGDEVLSISGMALDPETALPGMATDVDHHYLQRVFVPVAAAFVEGLGQAMAQTDSATITINNSGTATSATDNSKDTDEEIATGIDMAASELSEIIDEMNDGLEVTVRIDAGTPIGVLFVEPIMSGEEML